MLWTPRGLGGFGWSFSSTGLTRIAAGWGTTVTPGNNTMGAYARVLTAANLSQDVFGLLININNGAVSTNAKDTLLTVGIDPAGGTAYTDIISNLTCSQSGPATTGGGGINYFFPLWIQAGSSVAVKASVNNATVGTLACRMRVYGSPRDRRNIRVGTRVVTYGATPATSTGTAVTAGTTSDGAWTALGTIAAGDYPWWWQYGLGLNQGTTTATSYSADLGIGSAASKVIVGEDRTWTGTTTEQWWDSGEQDGYYQAAPGDIVYGRVQCSGTAMSGLSMIAYGMV